MRKILSLILVINIFAILFTGIEVNARTFSDVPTEHKYYTAIEILNEIGFMLGYPDGTFSPSGSLTRAEMAVITHNAFGIFYSPGGGASNPFRDLDDAPWAYSSIMSLAISEIIVPDGYLFRPNDNIKYIEALEWLVNASGFKQDAINAGGLPDGYKIIASNKGLLTNTSITNDNQNLTRGDVAQLLYNAINNKTLWSRNITVKIDGVGKQVYSDVNPISVNNDILVPVRFLAESVDMYVEWIDETQTVSFNNYLFLQMNNKTARFSDGTTKQIDNAMTLINDRMVAPIKFIVEQFGYDCVLDKRINTITLTSKPSPMEYTINDVTLQTTLGGTRSSIPTSGDFYVNVNLVKNVARSGDTIIVALYGNNDRLLRMYQDKDYLTPITTDITKTFPQLVSQVEGYTITKIRVFIWNDLDRILPLSNAGNYGI